MVPDPTAAGKPDKQLRLCAAQRCDTLKADFKSTRFVQPEQHQRQIRSSWGKGKWCITQMQNMPGKQVDVCVVVVDSHQCGTVGSASGRPCTRLQRSALLWSFEHGNMWFEQHSCTHQKCIACTQVCWHHFTVSGAPVPALLAQQAAAAAC
jgi:hypothetical protein